MSALPPEGHGGVFERSEIRQDCLENPVLDALAKALSPEEIEEGIGTGARMLHGVS
jgi:hypothetical protein